VTIDSAMSTHTDTHTHTHTFNGPLSRTTRVSQYQKGKTNLNFTGARDSEWQWHQLGRMQVCTSLQTDNHANTSPLSFLRAGCPSCRPTNSVKALRRQLVTLCIYNINIYNIKPMQTWRSSALTYLCSIADVTGSELINLTHTHTQLWWQMTHSAPFNYRVGQKRGPQTHDHNSVNS